MEIVDANGAKLRLTVRHGNRKLSLERARLHDGRSESIETCDAAVVLVLIDGDRELRRIPVQLVAGERNVVRC